MNRFFESSDHVVDQPSEPKTLAESAHGNRGATQRRFYENSDMKTGDPVLDGEKPAARTLLGGDDEQNNPGDDTSPDGDRSPAKVVARSINVPSNIAKLRESDSSFYDPVGTYRDVIGTGTTDDILPDQPEPIVREVAMMFRDAGLSGAEARLAVDALRARPIPETAAQWRRDVERYLDTVSDDDAQAAVRLLDRDPRVAELLERTGAVNHPEVVRLLIDKARAERTRGRL